MNHAQFFEDLVDGVAQHETRRLPDELYTIPLAMLAAKPFLHYKRHPDDMDWQTLSEVTGITNADNLALLWHEESDQDFYDKFLRASIASIVLYTRLIAPHIGQGTFLKAPLRNFVQLDDLRDVLRAGFTEAGIINRTPFEDTNLLRPILDLEYPLAFTDQTRLAHHVIVAPTDHGKSQTLEWLILSDLDRDDPPGMVVIDSKGDMVERLARLAVFQERLRDRLIIIDPRDAPALNLFDVGSVVDPETANRVTAQLAYFFRSLLGTEVSATMGSVFMPLAQLLLHVPEATLTTLLDAIDDVDQFSHSIAKLSPTLQRFFAKDFKEITGRETKNAVKRRIYAITTQSPSFEKMFNARRNALDLHRALDDGKVVLVSTERNYLQELSSIFGRYFIFRTITAALERSRQKVRKPAFLYIDEAGPYIDEKAEELFSTLRSYGLGAIMAFQYFGQIPAAYQRTIMANTNTKMIGGGSVEDAKIFADEMRVEPEFIYTQGRDNAMPPRFTRYATFIRNTSLPRAISLSVPIGELDRRPQITEQAYQALRERNRQALADFAPRPGIAGEPPPRIVEDPIKPAEPIKVRQPRRVKDVDHDADIEKPAKY